MCGLTCLLFWYYECFFKLLICKHAFVVFNCYFFECRVCRSKAQQSLCCICCFDMSTFNKTYKPELVTTRHSILIQIQLILSYFICNPVIVIIYMIYMLYSILTYRWYYLWNNTLWMCYEKLFHTGHVIHTRCLTTIRDYLHQNVLTHYFKE